MPNTAKLIERGSYGLLETILPTESPVVWTSVVTGKLPAKHGIAGFTRKQASGTVDELFNNKDRVTKAIWNIAGDFGRRVAVVGWWMTYPAEPVNGVMISQTNTSESFRRKLGMPWKGILKQGVAGQVYPPRLEAEIMGVLPDIQANLSNEVRHIFGPIAESLTPAAQKVWQSGLWSVRADMTYRQLSTSLLAERPPRDLSLVYFGGTDVYAHRFWRYYEPQNFSVTQRVDTILQFRDVLPNYYRHIDGVIGELVEQAGPDYRIFIIADHGMHPAKEDKLKASERGSSYADHDDAPPGVIIAAGPDISDMVIDAKDVATLRRRSLESLGSIMDITPTLLALMGLPIGRDMDDMVAEALIDRKFLDRFPPLYQDTHDDPAWLAERTRATRESDPLAVPDSRERLEQLRALGYLE